MKPSSEINPTIVCFKHGHTPVRIGNTLIRCAMCSKILVDKTQFAKTKKP